MTVKSLHIRPAAAVSLAIVGMALSAWAADIHSLRQFGRAFSQAAIDIAPGDTVRFVNDDPFLHQIYVYSSIFTFDSDEQPPGKVIDVTFPRTGTFIVQCHIHPTMRLVVNVK